MIELDEIVEEMAALLGAPCTLEDANFNLIGFSGQTDVDVIRQRSILERRSTSDVREWFHSQGIRTSAGPIRTPGEPDLGISARLCVPARHLGRVHGYFWLLDPDHLIAVDLWPDAMRLAEVAAMLLSQRSRHQKRLNLLYRDLIEGDRSTARIAARELGAAAGISVNEPVGFLVLEHVPTAANVAAWTRRDGVLWLEESESMAAVIARRGISTANHSRDELLKALGYGGRTRLDSTDLTIGVGPTVGSMDEVRRARWGALTALRVARGTSPDRLACWDSLGPLKLLGAAADQDLVGTLFTDRLHEFLADRHAEELVRTVRAYLDAAGSAAQAAAVLNIHRQTLYHRLEQVERRTGFDLKRGPDRTYLHTVLLLADFVPTEPR